MKQLFGIFCLILLPFIIGKTIYIGENNPDAEFSAGSVYPEHIAGAYTGGFGEQSCHSCHFDYDLNHPEGEFSVEGIAETFKPGQEHSIIIKVKREDMKRAGFQMTARLEDGSQAGQFEMNGNLTETPNIDNDISYIQHGVGKVQAEDGEKSWKVTWIAPDQKTGPVIFNVAANAANGDASEFGDWIYVKEIRLEPKP